MSPQGGPVQGLGDRPIWKNRTNLGQVCNRLCWKRTTDRYGGLVIWARSACDEREKLKQSVTEWKRSDKDRVMKTKQAELPFADYTIEHASEAIFWVASDARFLRINQAACEHLGYSSEELLEMTVHDIAPDYPREQWPMFWRRILQEKCITMESRHRRKDGAIVPIEITVNLLDYEGNLFMVSFVRNIAERKRIEEEMRDLARFPNENPNPILRISKDGKVLYRNQVSRPLLEAWESPGEGGLSDSVRRVVTEVFESGHSKEIEYVCGDQIYSVLFSPVHGEQYVNAYGRNITDKKAAELEIKSLAKFPGENPNPVLRISREGRILYANDGSQSFLKMWGTNKGEMLPDAWQRLIEETFDSSACREEDVVCGDRTYSVLITPIVESGYLNVYGRDITDRKRAEEALREALGEVERLRRRLEAENIYLQEEIKLENNFEEIISRSETLKKILRKVEQVASTDSTVLVLGETGTGKELLARAIHNLSRRRERPLVKINCAALPENLIESELFGHEKGAFTGALDRRIGRFELADGGTLFLDEIGDLPLGLQAKLLRVLQEGEFERLGSSATKRVDVRIIAATNHDLEEDAKAGRFREDLYYRLNVFPIRNPPLRERKEDIPLLAQHFVAKFAARMGKKIRKIPQSILQDLLDYRWPGNVRELENVLERAVIVSQGDHLQSGDWIPKDRPLPGRSQFPDLNELQREHILEALRLTGWRVSGEKGAAKLLGVKPTTLEARMKKLKIERGNT